jgi:hypothetical protein
MTCTGARLAAFLAIENQLSVPRDVRRSSRTDPVLGGAILAIEILRSTELMKKLRMLRIP